MSKKLTRFQDRVAEFPIPPLEDVFAPAPNPHSTQVAGGSDNWFPQTIIGCGHRENIRLGDLIR